VTEATDPIDYYKLLRVPYSASSREITRAYRDAMKNTHPDTVAPDFRATAEERAKLLNLAWRTLTKPAERLKYDQSLRKTVIQDQIMSSYFGGMGMPGGQQHDPFAEALRRETSHRERREMAESTRSATVTILLVFGGATALVVCFVVLWSVAADLVRAVL